MFDMSLEETLAAAGMDDYDCSNSDLDAMEDYHESWAKGD